MPDDYLLHGSINILLNFLKDYARIYHGNSVKANVVLHHENDMFWLF